MTRIHVRDFHSDDLDQLVRLWNRAAADVEAPVYSLAEVIASCQVDHAVVAVRGEELVGAAVGRAARSQGWIVFFEAPDPDSGGVLLDELERRMSGLGLAKLSVLVPQSHGIDPFTTNAFESRDSVRYLERPMPVQRREVELLRELGGRVLPRNLWRAVAGMTAEKDLLEERLITPLAQPDLADRFGVVPPHAVMLFGPPGTGKTTFARAVASRLDWPFIEIFPSRLADSGGGLASALRSTFESVGGLEHAVVFIDEVEEIASRRGGLPPSPTQGVTNELLKLVAEFREREGRLLICATNFIRALDAAFLRHGRFDYVIPIGLPDAEARRAIWGRYVPEESAATVDIGRLVDESDGLTPADIEYAARRASQAALARALRAGGEAAAAQSVGTDDYLRALNGTRATVSDEAIADFLEDIDALARL